LIRLEVKNKHNQIRYYICTLIYIDDSDIGFNYEFLKVHNNIVKIISNPTYILCGTCGSNMEIGECFFIDTAYKYDRGIIKGNNNKYVFELDLDKKLKYVSSFEIDKLKNATTFSGNFLLNCNISNFVQNELKYVKNENEIIVGEMETFEFYKICSNNNDIKNYFCLRIVSDNFLKNDEQIFEILQKSELLRRLDIEVKKINATDVDNQNEKFNYIHKFTRKKL